MFQTRIIVAMRNEVFDEVAVIVFAAIVRNPDAPAIAFGENGRDPLAYIGKIVCVVWVGFGYPRAQDKCPSECGLTRHSGLNIYRDNIFLVLWTMW
ncbi:MAG: hypothetical protein IVW55_12280 [Chloroflexi bacterium]|nr:hypothetical protein [Chloroflexota bacterium]